MTEFLIFSIMVAIIIAMLFFFGWTYFFLSLVFIVFWFIWGWTDGKDED